MLKQNTNHIQLRYLLFICTSISIAIGLILLFNITYSLDNYQLKHIKKQFISFLMSCCIATCFYFFPFKYIKRYYLIFSLLFLLPSIYLAFISLCYKMNIRFNFPFFPGPINGAFRWLRFGGFSFQVTEFIKIAIIFFFPFYYQNRIHNDELKDQKRFFWLPFFIALFMLGINLLTRSVSSTFSNGLLIFFLFFIFGVLRLKNIVIMIFVGLVLIFTLSKIDNVFSKRVLSWLNLGSDRANQNYQINRSKAAIGSGGVWGKGLGKGIMKKKILPESHNDFIFSAIAEELGFIGLCAVIIIFYFPLIFICLFIAQRSKHLANMGISSSIAFYFSTTILLHLAVISHILPTTGIPAIFFGYGGSNLLSALILIALIANIDKTESKKY